MTETFLPIPPLPHYEAGDAGTVRKAYDKRVLPRIHVGGHECVRLRDSDGRYRPYRVAALVLHAHVGPPPTPNCAPICKDGSWLRLTLDNLAWSPPRLTRAQLRAAHRAQATPEAETPDEAVTAADEAAERLIAAMRG